MVKPWDKAATLVLRQLTKVFEGFLQAVQLLLEFAQFGPLGPQLFLSFDLIGLSLLFFTSQGFELGLELRKQILNLLPVGWRILLIADEIFAVLDIRGQFFSFGLGLHEFRASPRPNVEMPVQPSPPALVDGRRESVLFALLQLYFASLFATGGPPPAELAAFASHSATFVREERLKREQSSGSTTKNDAWFASPKMLVTVSAMNVLPRIFGPNVNDCQKSLREGSRFGTLYRI